MDMNNGKKIPVGDGVGQGETSLKLFKAERKEMYFVITNVSFFRVWIIFLNMTC